MNNTELIEHLIIKEDAFIGEGTEDDRLVTVRVGAHRYLVKEVRSTSQEIMLEVVNLAE